MEENIISDLAAFKASRYIKTYSKTNKMSSSTKGNDNNYNTSSIPVAKRIPLTTKNAMKYLLEGTLKEKVCRYCLNVTSGLSELDQFLQLAGQGTLYKVTIRDMVASFHPIKVSDDTEFPNKICNKCLDRTITSYLFTQQCERAERALRNCFEDMNEKLDKLDPLDRPKKRGRQKLNPNYNILYTDHEEVINYAEPLINIIHTAAESLTTEGFIKDFECPKCSQVLPNVESLLNHEKSHPKSMWYHCRLCGKSFPKRHHWKKHINTHLIDKPVKSPNDSFTCNRCGEVSKDCNEYLRHIEKHKFKVVMEHLVEKKMDELCSVCLDNSSNLTSLDKMVSLHGGHSDMAGDRSLYSVLASTIPEMNQLYNYTGTKICQKCLNNAVTSYIFIHQYHFSRNRLNTCVDLMLDSLTKVDSPENNIFVEISHDAIMPVHEEYDKNLLIDDHEDIDESKLKIEVLEDEFRLKEDEDSDEQPNTQTHIDSDSDTSMLLYNPAKDARQTYSTKNKVFNGYQLSDTKEKVSEFLTFKKKKPPRRPYKCKYTCPLCSKQFITEYFLTKHVLKHLNKKSRCKYCDLYFKSKFYLYEHTKMVHLLKQTNYYSCKTCGRAFVDHHKLTTHESNHQKKMCDICDKTFTIQKHHDSHVQRHAAKWWTLMRSSSKSCSFCEKEYTGAHKLSLHVNKVHLQIKPYSCDMCEKQFYTEYDLKNHKKIHDMPTKERCNFCDKVLKSRKQLVIHVRKHIGVTPYNCQFCEQSFYSLQTKREHMKVYHGSRFLCQFCNNASNTKYELKEHIARAHNII